MVAVVEQADVPAGLQLVEKAGEGAGVLGKLETDQPLVGNVAGAAADHIAQVDFGHFVVAQIDIG